jgi:hypothetical protein
VSFNGALHPRAPKGTATGGEFTAGGSKSQQKTAPASAKKTTPKPPPKKAKPESLQAIAAKRAAGKPLTPEEKHLWHLNHVNVMKRKATMAAAATAKPKTTAKPKAAPKKTMTSGQKTKAMQMAKSGR